MSMHKEPLTGGEREGLIKHGLALDNHSQLSDAFRLGMRWAQQCSIAAKPSINEEALRAALASISTPALSDKSQFTLGEWIQAYGGRTNDQTYLEFGSVMALHALLARRDIEVTRALLKTIINAPTEKAQEVPWNALLPLSPVSRSTPPTSSPV